MTRVVKFLRRSRNGNSEIFEETGLDILEQIKAAEAKEPDAETITKAILRRVDILQNRDKKIKLLRSIARLSHPWVCAVFMELLADPSEEIRDIAVQELARRDDCPIFKIYERLAHPPWYVKSAILKILSLKKNAEAVRHIQSVIDDPNVEVKRYAAQALGEIGGKEARTLLVRLSKDSNPYVRMAAVEALEKICDLKFI